MDIIEKFFKLYKKQSNFNFAPKLLLEKVVDNNLYYHLLKAVYNNNLRMAYLLLQNGANVHAQNDRVLIHSSKNGYLDLVKFLISVGANVFDKNDDGNSPIILASEHGHLDVVDYLISVGANLDDKNNRGYNSIFLAYRNNKLDIVKLLIEKGANIHEQFDNVGNNLIMY